jgi:uncharacterized protein
MKNKLTHFAIHIDNIDRAKQFYQGVFEWGFASYGPPDFLQIKTDQSENGELIGALQSRRYSPVKEKIVGLECTIGVESVDEVITRVEKSGGENLMQKLQYLM